ncbi:MAG: methyltransferase domain-containing protein [Puniceicoccaceae bacterium]|nr:MAG: methyltransferase domain-containing protein [Puniceicoccaceae bacterium]
MAKDWNKAYEMGETPWDKGYASPPLGEFLTKWGVTGRVLVPGCGTGHDVRLLAGKGADVVGMDIAQSAIFRAEAFPAVSRECYVLSDFLDLAASYRATFDWVVEHTCLCALDPSERSAYVDSVCAALKPKASFLAIFFREVSDYSGTGPPHPISREEIDLLFGPHFECVQSFIPTQTYPSRPVGSEEVCWMRML